MAACMPARMIVMMGGIELNRSHRTRLKWGVMVWGGLEWDGIEWNGVGSGIK